MDPFQVVRMGPLEFYVCPRIPLHKLAPMAQLVESRPQTARTIVALWRNAVARATDRPAYLAERDGGWVEVSWAEAARRVDDIANGLLSLGVRKGDTFAILASTSLEWCLFDFALGLTGAIGAPVYANSSPQDCAYVIGHSESVGVFVEDDEQFAKIAAIRAQLPRLRHVLTFADLRDLEARGREFAAEHPSALDEASAQVGEEDLFTYIYTSGTTGPPKGCMIRHRNYYEMAAVVEKMPTRFVGPGDTLLLYLPLAHNYGRLIHLQAVYVGYTLAFCRDPLRVGEALAGVRPTVFPSVPRVYEKVHTALVARMDEARGTQRAIGNWALRIGREVSGLRRAGRPLPAWLALRHRLADRLVYSQDKKRLGGRLRIANSGGAPLSLEIMEFFHAFDILILEGYGLTECTTACSVNRPDRYKLGTVGPPLPGFEVELAEDGELLIRSETVFAGYYKDEEATRAVLDEGGWLRTGDIAQIDDDGFITITDRKKDILVTSGGKNVAPQNLENELKASRYISQALVVGDRRPYVAALVTLDADEVVKWRSDGGRDVEALVQGIVDEVNVQHSRFEQIKRFAILPRDFSAEEDEITPTLKLKRRVVQEHFAGEIEALYS
jgi:long-chain acyl-CoA synthetase